jgi:hypothetical protein
MALVRCQAQPNGRLQHYACLHAQGQFLSHSSKNNAEALAMREWLASQGWNDVFLDIDPERGLVAADRWQKALNAARRSLSSSDLPAGAGVARLGAPHF